MTIPRTDPRGASAFVLQAVARLDTLKPRVFRYVSPGTGKVQEVECAWDERPTQALKTTVRDDQEGVPRWVRYVRVRKERMSWNEQARKLCGIFPELKAWTDPGALEYLAHQIEGLRAAQRKAEPAPKSDPRPKRVPADPETRKRKAAFRNKRLRLEKKAAEIEGNELVESIADRWLA
jgi:hypothetical protein